MKIIALLKCWSGEDWLHVSVNSIIPHVEKVVLLTSSVSWLGGRENPSLPVVEELKRQHPQKIVHINYDTPDQMEHCEYGFNYIKKHFDCDFIQLIDSDEVWDDGNYRAAINYLKENPEHLVYRTQMHTYIKSVYNRVSPMEPLKPVCFISPKLENMGTEPRACSIRPFDTMPNVACHHFVFVRYHFNKVLEKLVQSHVSENQAYAPMDRWIPEVWNKLPDYNRELFPNGFHMARGFESNWKEINRIGIHDLPGILHRPEYRHILTFGSN